MVLLSRWGHWESSPSSSAELNADWAPGGCQPSNQTKPTSCKSGGRLLSSTSTSHLLLLLGPKADTLFYHPIQGGRLSRPRHCSKSVQPKVACRGGFMVNNCRQWDLNLGQARYHWTTATCRAISMWTSCLRLLSNSAEPVEHLTRWWYVQL